MDEPFLPGDLVRAIFTQVGNNCRGLWLAREIGQVQSVTLGERNARHLVVMLDHGEEVEVTYPPAMIERIFRDAGKRWDRGIWQWQGQWRGPLAKAAHTE